MAETPYLVDSNVLLRWVKPNHRDYPLIVSATDAILRHDGILCYTSQNVGEFWSACTRPVDRNGYGLTPQETDRLAKTFEEKLRLLPDSLAVHEEWRRLLVTKQRLWRAGSRCAPRGGNAGTCRKAYSHIQRQGLCSVH
jgi:hypothetical protein